MRFIKNWYYRIFVLPKQIASVESRIHELLPELRTLKRNLESIRRRVNIPVTEMHPADKLGLIVEFFALVSPWHDRELEGITAPLKGNSFPSFLSLEDLAMHFHNAGRHEHGYNRTRPGQAVTADHVWLGDRCGLSTKRVSYWKSYRGDTSKVVYATNGQPMMVCDVIWWQAGEFLNRHLSPMIQLIERLECEVELKKAA